MAINDFALACSIDGSPHFSFTYHEETMVIMQSEQDAKARKGSFVEIDSFMGAFVSHEAIHVAIKKLEGDNASESLDNIEVIVEHDGRRYQVTLNNILFAKDVSGLVMP